MNKPDTHNGKDRSVPPAKKQRDDLRQIVADYSTTTGLKAPLTTEQLQKHLEKIIQTHKIDPDYTPFLAVLLHNRIWQATLAGIPCHKRLLLLPQCLRDHDHCKATQDQLGLICAHCGRCRIHDIQTLAQQLGYAVLVADGSPAVITLLQTGKLHSVIGVGCMESLKKIYPIANAMAIPSLAVPLLRNGCVNTEVDIDWLQNLLRLSGPPDPSQPDLETLSTKVKSWFDHKQLKKLTGWGDTKTHRIALDWLAGDGKRWRPFLTAGVFQAMTQKTIPELPEQLSRVAVAVECFHKASLIHDDIEDHDAMRYGRQTLHQQHGIEIAINVGDFLLGQGYGLICESDIEDPIKLAMLQIASKGHRQLALGQGEELYERKYPSGLSLEKILETYQQKTAPAFKVALNLGALLAGASPPLCQTLSAFSRTLGLAYQIDDDITEFFSDQTPPEPTRLGYGLIPALAQQLQDKPLREKTLQFINHQIQHPNASSQDRQKQLAFLRQSKLYQQADQLRRQYQTRAMNCLTQLQNPPLEQFLRRMMVKIFRNTLPISGPNEYS